MTVKKPEIIKRLEGNPGQRKIVPDLVVQGNPTPPDYLSKEQLDRWRDIVAALPDKLLKTADNAILERMAVAWATFREAARAINKMGLLVKDADGRPMRNPLLVVKNAAAAEMQDCGNGLGLSPLARTRISNPDDFEDDPLELLLGPNGKAWGSEKIVPIRKPK